MTLAHRAAEPRARVRFAEWAQAILLAVNLAWTTLGLGGYRPATMAVTIGLTLATLAVHFASQAAAREASQPSWAVGAWPLVFLGYALINALCVSPVPWLGWLDWWGWANLIAVFWVSVRGVRSPWPRQVLFGTLVGLGIVGVLLGCYQRFLRPDWLMLGRHQVEQFLGRASGSFGIPNSFAGFLILLLPALGALAFRQRATATERVWWGWVLLVFALGLLLSLSRGAWIALGIAFVVWPLAGARWRWSRRAGVSVAVLIGVAVLGGTLYQASPKARDRIARLVRDSGENSRPVLWRAAWDLFRAHPAVGAGAGSYNVLFERHRPPRFLDEPQWAHNEYLNTLSDYGALGLGLLAGGALLTAAQARRRNPERESTPRDWLRTREVSGALGIGLLAFALQLFVDFHLKIPALAMAFAVVAALATEAEPATVKASARSRRARLVWIAAAIICATAIVPVTRCYRAEALRHGAREVLDGFARYPAEERSIRIARAEQDLQRAVALWPRHAQAWSDLAFARELQAVAAPERVAEFAGPAEQAARRAAALSEVVTETWLRLGVALDMQGRFAEAQPAFERALALSPHGLPAWYYYAYHLSLDTKQRAAALRAIATGLSLDPGNRAAEALEAKLKARPQGSPVVP